MRGLAVVVAVAAVATVACTHDFGAFETSGTYIADSGSDITPSDTGVGVDTAPPSETTPPDDTAPAPDTTPPSETGPSCTDPGGALFDGHCYFPLATTATWSTAKSSCESTSAHLVTITSAAEESFVEAIRPGTQRWMGLSRPTTASPTDPKSFVWVTAEPVTFQKWAAGEPNGTGECGRLRNSNDWSDDRCTSMNVVVCERE